MSLPLIAEQGWHYAAWIAFDLRLVLFAALLAALTAGGITALVVRSTKKRDYLALWLLCFVGLFVTTVFFMNEIAHHPVFVVESMFPFP